MEISQFLLNFMVKLKLAQSLNKHHTIKTCVGKWRYSSICYRIVSILNTLRDERLGFNLRQRQEYLSSSQRWDQLWGPQYLMEKGNSFPGEYSSRNMKLVAQLHLLDRRRKFISYQFNSQLNVERYERGKHVCFLYLFLVSCLDSCIHILRNKRQVQQFTYIQRRCFSMIEFQKIRLAAPNLKQSLSYRTIHDSLPQCDTNSP
jgi:hypothetical protein